MKRPIDLITIGRASVDLYGDQIGGRLEDMASFSKYIGGSPTNIAAGAARLGLRSALITRVGDEHFGRFVREQLKREGVDTRFVLTDPERLTALAILGIRDVKTFPLLFYRENCADMALSESDIDPGFIAEATCLCATGTHLSNPITEAAVLKAVRAARDNGTKTALDIDFRPNLWGLAGHSEGESRFVASESVTSKLQSTLGLFDLIVGTEEEFHIAGGSTNTISALRNVRKITAATLVCKRGPMGAVAFRADIPASLDDGETGPGFEIEVFNVLGAGDGFMAGLLKGWLDGEDWPIALKYANACGALAVSRHGCTPSYPSLAELEYFLDRGVRTPALRKDRDLEQVHWATNRSAEWPNLKVFAFNQAERFEKMAVDRNAALRVVSRFMELCLEAARQAARGRDGFGIVCDAGHGRDAVFKASGTGLWIGRPAKGFDSSSPGCSRELGPDLGGLADWPLEHVVNARIRLANRGVDLDQQIDVLVRLFSSARRNRLEFLMEAVIPSSASRAEHEFAEAAERVYAAGIFPDWWKLSGAQPSAWERLAEAIKKNDSHCRGGLIGCDDATSETLVEVIESAAHCDFIRGFVVGDAVIGRTAEKWFGRNVGDADAVDEMSSRFAELCDCWDKVIALRAERLD